LKMNITQCFFSGRNKIPYRGKRRCQTDAQ
jgi:hypothetical protein